MLGLIANNFVRVYHPAAATATTTSPVLTDVTHRRRDPLARALLHRRQLRLRHQARQPHRQGRDRPEVPRCRRHRRRLRQRLHQGLQVRRPAAVPQPAVLPRADRRQLARDPLERAGPGAAKDGGGRRDLDQTDQARPRRPVRRGTRPAASSSISKRAGEPGSIGSSLPSAAISTPSSTSPATVSASTSPTRARTRARLRPGSAEIVRSMRRDGLASARAPAWRSASRRAARGRRRGRSAAAPGS